MKEKKEGKMTSTIPYSFYVSAERLEKEKKEVFYETGMMVGHVNQVRDEDIEPVELVQTGFHSQAFSGGINSPRENELNYFHNKYREEIPNI